MGAGVVAPGRAGAGVEVLAVVAFAVSAGVCVTGTAGAPATTVESPTIVVSTVSDSLAQPSAPRVTAIKRFLIIFSLTSRRPRRGIVPSPGRLVNSKRRASLGMMTRFGGRASAAVLLLFATPLAAQRSDRRVVDRAAIARAGWHRLGDIAEALPPGSSASVEGFNHELRGSRVGFFQTTGVTASWVVRLDGQLVPMQVGGVWVLDEIPVAITQLDSIVITEGPQLTDGRGALLGTIDLYTRRVRGASVIGDYQHGDETGDPGPYRYTSRSTRNVEKLGPFASGAVAAGNPVAAIDIGARYSSLNITDGRIAARLGATAPGYQTDVNASGGSGVATFDVLGGRTYVVGGRGRFTGFFPTAAAGVNQQARIVASHAGISGTIDARQTRWRYTASGTGMDVDPLGAVLLTTPQSERLFVDGLLEGELSTGWRAGIGGTGGRLKTAADEQTNSSLRGWLGYSRPDEIATVAVERSAGRFRYSGSARMTRAINDSDRVGLTVTRLESWRFGDFAWMDQPTADSSGTTAADLRADLATGAIASVRPTWYARAFAYAGIGANPVRGVAIGVAATTPTEATFGARVRGEITQLLGEAGTGESSTPGGYIEGNVSTRTDGGFHLAVAGRYAPRTHWAGSSDDIPATRRVDFSVNKAMWHDRIRAQFVMRNLLNAEERTHPEGAQWNLRTHLAITIALPSGAGR